MSYYSPSALLKKLGKLWPWNFLTKMFRVIHDAVKLQKPLIRRNLINFYWDKCCLFLKNCAIALPLKRESLQKSVRMALLKCTGSFKQATHSAFSITAKGRQLNFTSTILKLKKIQGHGDHHYHNNQNSKTGALKYSYVNWADRLCHYFTNGLFLRVCVNFHL